MRSYIAKILISIALLFPAATAGAETAAKRLAEFKLLGHWAGASCAEKPSSSNTHTVFLVSSDSSAEWYSFFRPNEATLVKIDEVEKQSDGLISIKGRQLPSDKIVALLAVKNNSWRTMFLWDNGKQMVADGVIFNGAETKWFTRCN